VKADQERQPDTVSPLLAFVDVEIGAARRRDRLNRIQRNTSANLPLCFDHMPAKLATVYIMSAKISSASKPL